jgi:hypothetical protein
VMVFSRARVQTIHFDILEASLVACSGPNLASRETNEEGDVRVRELRTASRLLRDLIET